MIYMLIFYYLYAEYIYVKKFPTVRRFFTSVVCLFVIIVFTAVKVLLDKNLTDLEG